MMYAEERNMDFDLLQVWRFLRGDLESPSFEKWLYGSPHLEQVFGADLYLTAISTIFTSEKEVQLMTDELRAWAEDQSRHMCPCVKSPVRHSVGLSSDPSIMDSLESCVHFGDARWWLSLDQCAVCSEYWLVAADMRQNDEFYLRRLPEVEVGAILESGKWPPDFPTYESLLQAGIDYGRSVDWVYPGSSTLGDSIEELARARPGITISEICKLLNIGAEVAGWVLERLPDDVRSFVAK